MRGMDSGYTTPSSTFSDDTFSDTSDSEMSSLKPLALTGGEWKGVGNNADPLHAPDGGGRNARSTEDDASVKIRGAEAALAESLGRLATIQRDERLQRAEVERRRDTLLYLRLCQLRPERDADHPRQEWELAKFLASQGCAGDETVALVRKLMLLRDLYGASLGQDEEDMSLVARSLAGFPSCAAAAIRLVREIFDRVFPDDFLLDDECVERAVDATVGCSASTSEFSSLWNCLVHWKGALDGLRQAATAAPDGEEPDRLYRHISGKVLPAHRKLQERAAVALKKCDTNGLALENVMLLGVVPFLVAAYATLPAKSVNKIVVGGRPEGFCAFFSSACSMLNHPEVDPGLGPDDVRRLDAAVDDMRPGFDPAALFEDPRLLQSMRAAALGAMRVPSDFATFVSALQWKFCDSDLGLIATALRKAAGRSEAGRAVVEAVELAGLGGRDDKIQIGRIASLLGGASDTEASALAAFAAKRNPSSLRGARLAAVCGGQLVVR